MANWLRAIGSQQRSRMPGPSPTPERQRMHVLSITDGHARMFLYRPST
jgi:hypothetical protein